MRENFDKASEIERQYLSNIPGIITFIPSNNSDFYDAICFFSADTMYNVIAEAKVRTFTKDTYPTAILEKAKVDRLIETYKYYNNTYKLFYFAYYPEDKLCYVFDILNTPHKITIGMMLPSTTMGDKRLVPTDVIEYNLNDAVLHYTLDQIFE